MTRVTRVTPRALEEAFAAVSTVRCGEDLHRVGVTTRGQAVMLDHDRRLERLAVGLEPEARTPCAEVYDALRRFLAGETLITAETDYSLALATVEDQDDLAAYVRAARPIRQHRQAAEAHTQRLTQVSVLAGGPPLLAGWAHPASSIAPLPNRPYRDRDAILLQAQKRARRDALDRLVPELFLRAGYPIVARHPPAGPGVRRGACWHITVTELGPTDAYQVATTPHPDGHGRVCHAVAVPLAPDWYRSVYTAGLAVLDGALVVKVGELGSGGDRAFGALRFVQKGARFHLEDVAVEGTPAGWRRVPRPSRPLRTEGAPRGTGVRPSPWD